MMPKQLISSQLRGRLMRRCSPLPDTATGVAGSRTRQPSQPMASSTGRLHSASAWDQSSRAASCGVRLAPSAPPPIMQAEKIPITSGTFWAKACLMRPGSTPCTRAEPSPQRAALAMSRAPLAASKRMALPMPSSSRAASN